MQDPGDDTPAYAPGEAVPVAGGVSATPRGHAALSSGGDAECSPVGRSATSPGPDRQSRAAAASSRLSFEMSQNDGFTRRGRCHQTPGGWEVGTSPTQETRQVPLASRAGPPHMGAAAFGADECLVPTVQMASRNRAAFPAARGMG